MARTFPLYLTHFEKYMLNDDSVDYPMTFVVQFRFSGTLNREAMDAAFAQALQRHPLLRAIVQPAKRGEDCWVSFDSEQKIDWGAIDAPITFRTGEFINLREEPGMRVWIRSSGDDSILTAQFHHSSCDGIGSYQFLGDVLWYYGKAFNEPDLPELPELDVTALRNRGAASYDPDKFRMPNGKFRSEVGYYLKLNFGRTDSIARPSNQAPETSAYPSIQSHSFSKPEYKQIRLEAKKHGQNTNEAILEALFESAYEWNCKKAGKQLNQSLCVMVPMDLREARETPFSAINCVTYALLRGTSQQMTASSGFSDWLVQEMTRLKHSRHSSRLMNLVASSSNQHPLFTKFLLKRNRCLATAVLSNTGDPTRSFSVDLPREGGAVKVGGLVLEDISGVPPMRRNTNATLSIFTYRRALKLCLRCTPKLFDSQQSENFLNLLVEKLVAKAG